VPGKPFCDIDGEYAESGMQRNTCTTTPVGCPIGRCGCTAGTRYSCDGEALTVCADDERSTTTVACPLGCSPSELRCLSFEPRNGLSAALAMAPQEQDVVLPPGARVDTDLGRIEDAASNAIDVRSVVVMQGVSAIRVFIAKSFVFDSLTIRGGAAFAAVASGPIRVRGFVDASANATTKGPGGLEEPAPCAGLSSSWGPSGCTVNCGAYGAGGGGNATAGALGGGNNAVGYAGGSVITTFEPLVGGCSGGLVRDPQGAVTYFAGGGGGAIQLVSLESIDFTSNGTIDVGGGGGQLSSGGGSGGTVILEAPRVRFDGTATGLVANGGAGGGCGMVGADGNYSVFAASGPKCSPNSAGNGATAMLAPEPGEVCTGACIVGYYGGGGGAVGRLLVVTRTATHGRVGSPVFSVAITDMTLSPH
jgi:hypothetical protein